MPMQAISAGLLAGLVGFASSFAVVLQGFVAMGASPSQAASGLMAVSIAMGLCGVLLSLWKRMPISSKSPQRVSGFSYSSTGPPSNRVRSAE